MDISDVEVKPRVGEIQIQEPETITNPWDLMNNFYSSKKYKDAFKQFFEGKVLDSSVSEKEKERVFLESATAEEVFFRYATDDVDFRYESEHYPDYCRKEIEEYAKLLKDVKKMEQQKLSDDEVSALDRTMFKTHTDAAKSLVRAGVAPSNNVGRALVSLIMVNKKLTTVKEAQTTTLTKIKSKLGII